MLVLSWTDSSVVCRWVTVQNVLLSLGSLLFALSLLLFVKFWLFYVFNYSFYVSFLVLYVLLSILCVMCFCAVLCIVAPHVYIYFLFTDHCHRVEKIQLQLINSISHHIYVYLSPNVSFIAKCCHKTILLHVVPDTTLYHTDDRQLVCPGETAAPCC